MTVIWSDDAFKDWLASWDLHIKSDLFCDDVLPESVGHDPDEDAVNEWYSKHEYTGYYIETENDRSVGIFGSMISPHFRQISTLQVFVFANKAKYESWLKREDGPEVEPWMEKV